MLGSIKYWYQRTQRMPLQFRIKLTSLCVPGTKNAEVYRWLFDDIVGQATLWDTRWISLKKITRVWSDLHIPCPFSMTLEQIQDTAPWFTAPRLWHLLDHPHWNLKMGISPNWFPKCFRHGTVPQAQHTVSLELRWVNVEEKLGRTKYARQCQTSI